MRSGTEKRRLVQALAGAGEKAPLSSDSEMDRRVTPLQVKEVRTSQVRIQVEPRVMFTTRPEPLQSAWGVFLRLEPNL